MLGKVGVGKGLNVKGKSSKKNRLSGFVPFLQISDNAHKKDLAESPPGARMTIYYQSAEARDECFTKLNAVLNEMLIAEVAMDAPEIKLLDEYAPEAFGVRVPERVLRELYITRPDVSPMLGWETGRNSEPAFMDMNMQAVRGDSVPSVVLYQHDKADPLNPLGLLIGYAEKLVKPVVSDFDTFLIGSRGFKYEQPTPPKQVELIKWCLGHTEQVLENPGAGSWTGRWLQVLKQEALKGFKVEFPKYGFGDPTSYRLVDDVVNVTSANGAVRHGAECFNFYFPQELDEEFLVVWEGFSDPPWRSKTDPELREFLLERIEDGFSFPLNPVWPVRDKGWHEVLEALQRSKAGAENLRSWYPPESGVLENIWSIHKRFPDGFHPTVASGLKRAPTRTFTNAMDMAGEEMADFALEEINKAVKARWRRLRIALLKIARAKLREDRRLEEVEASQKLASASQDQAWL